MKRATSTPKLGLDFGRVLAGPGPVDSGEDTSFVGGSVDDALATPPFPGMFEVVPQLVERFGGRVWLVSKARSLTQHKTRLWLAHHNFFQRTGIAPDNLHFCHHRQEKALHCRKLGITHFVDDRLDVLGHLEGIVERRYLFGKQKRGVLVPDTVTHVADWPAALVTIK